MASLLKTDGTETLVTPANGKKFTLEEMQKYVGGYIEIVRGPNSSKLIVNEEGLLQGLPLNRLASLAANRYIVGDVLVLLKGDKMQ